MANSTISMWEIRWTIKFGFVENSLKKFPPMRSINTLCLWPIAAVCISHLGTFVSPLGKCHKVHFQFRRTIQICVISWPTLQVGFSKRGTVEFLEKVNRHYLRQKYFINRRHEWCCWHMTHYTTQDATFSGLSDDNNKAPVYRTFPHLTVGNTLCRNLICTR